MRNINYSSRQGVTPYLNFAKALILNFCNSLKFKKEKNNGIKKQNKDNHIA